MDTALILFNASLFLPKQLQYLGMFRGSECNLGVSPLVLACPLPVPFLISPFIHLPRICLLWLLQGVNSLGLLPVIFFCAHLFPGIPTSSFRFHLSAFVALSCRFGGVCLTLSSFCLFLPPALLVVDACFW